MVGLLANTVLSARHVDSWLAAAFGDPPDGVLLPWSHPPVNASGADNTHRAARRINARRSRVRMLIRKGTRLILCSGVVVRQRESRPVAALVVWAPLGR